MTEDIICVHGLSLKKPCKKCDKETPQEMKDLLNRVMEDTS